MPLFDDVSDKTSTEILKDAALAGMGRAAAGQVTKRITGFAMDKAGDKLPMLVQTPEGRVVTEIAWVFGLLALLDVDAIRDRLPSATDMARKGLSLALEDAMQRGSHQAFDRLIEIAKPILMELAGIAETLELPDHQMTAEETLEAAVNSNSRERVKVE